jgi:Secretory lipase
MNRASLAAICAMGLLGGVVTPAVAAPAPRRGELISAVPVAALTAGQVRTYLKDAGLAPTPVRFGVRAERIVYRTVTPAGRPTTASGLVVLPAGGARSLRPVAWLHSTISARSEAPSVGTDAIDGNRAASYTFASEGYAVTAPDYLGLGTGPGFHPWMEVGSEVTASVDALRATRTLVHRAHRDLDKRVRVSGFSQGAPATMALGRALQDRVDPHFGLAALAPISGPYDWSSWLRNAVAGRASTINQPDAAFYLGYLLVAWNRQYHLYNSPSEAFRTPYDTTVTGLFDGYHTEDSVFAKLPSTPQALLTPRFIALLKNPTGPLARAVKPLDDVCGWHSKAPVTLYAAHGDQSVPISNSRTCVKELGGAVRLVDVGNYDHIPSVIQSVPSVLAWFNQIKG